MCILFLEVYVFEHVHLWAFLNTIASLSLIIISDLFIHSATLQPFIDPQSGLTWSK